MATKKTTKKSEVCTTEQVQEPVKPAEEKMASEPYDPNKDYSATVELKKADYDELVAQADVGCEKIKNAIINMSSEDVIEAVKLWPQDKQIKIFKIVAETFAAELKSAGYVESAGMEKKIVELQNKNKSLSDELGEVYDMLSKAQQEVGSMRRLLDEATGKIAQPSIRERLAAGENIEVTEENAAEILAALEATK